MSTDVLVVGAGPAGATVAGGLAEAGLRVTVLEKSQLPRYKPCSGGLPAKARPLIPLDDATLDDLSEDVVHNVRFTHRNRDPVLVTSERPLVYTVRRERFDHALVGQAARKGARFLDGVEVLGVDPAGRRVRVRTTRGEFSARVVLGADGVQSAVARSVGLAAREKMGFAMLAEVPVKAEVLERWRGMVGGDFGHMPRGIGWIFPKSDHLSVGMLSFRPGSKVAERSRSELFAFLRGQGIGVDDARTRVYGHYLPRWHGQRTFQVGNVLLLGDAAGIINPLTGAGIESSMRSAHIATDVVKHAFWHGDDLLNQYSERVGREICREFLDVRAMARFFFRFTGVFYQLGIKHPAFHQIAARLLTGAIDYTEVWGELSRAIGRDSDNNA